MNLRLSGKSLLSLSAFLAATSSAVALGSEWELDPSHTTVQFSVRHMMVSSVKGHFEKVTGSVTLDDKNPGRSAVEVAIDARSLNTRDPKRDGHLRSADFFDADKHPSMTFKSTKVEPAGKGKLKVTGELTLRGVTKTVALNVEGPTPEMKSPWGTAVRGLSATGKLNRKDFGLTWNKALEAGGVVVGEEVEIQIDAELAPKAPAAAAK
jgi:polyisoprenoid-binding protein YceI